MVNREPDTGEEAYFTETRYSKETGQPCVSFTRLNGLLHSPPDGTPSYVLFDAQGRATLLKWHHQDQLHREGAAATIYVEPTTGVHTFEVFYSHGQPRARHLGPYRVYRDRLTGEVTKQQFSGDPDFPNGTSGPDLS